MKLIPLSATSKAKNNKGKYFAIVNNSDHSWLSKWNWSACITKNAIYARRSTPDGDIKMHREILGLKRGDGKESDHKNHNGLDNRRRNLRVSTPSQNMANRRPKQGLTSKYKGVHRNQEPNGTIKWIAMLKHKGKRFHLGRFKTEKLAAMSYDVAAKKYHKEFAFLNFK